MSPVRVGKGRNDAREGGMSPVRGGEGGNGTHEGF